LRLKGKVHGFHRDTMVVVVPLRLYVGSRFVEVEEGPRVPSRYDGGCRTAVRRSEFAVE